MDAEEIKKKLAELGIQTGAWGSTKPGAKRLPPTVQRQRDALAKLKQLLEAQLEADKAKRAELHVTLQRIRHGGGG